MLHFLAVVFVLGGCWPFVKGCCIPTQWESIVGLQNVSATGTVLGVRTATLAASYDFINKKVAYQGDDIKRVMDYNKMIQYFITYGHCFHGKLSKPLPNCMPANASVITTFEMGGPNGITLAEYDHEILPWPKGTLLINPKGCIPFSQTLANEGSIETLTFMNVTLGIKDPSVFDVPSPPCPKDTDNIMNVLQDDTVRYWPLLPSLP